MSDPPADLHELLKVMAHDLRNPLSAILTNLHFLGGSLPGGDVDAREALEDSLSLCDVLERLIGNLDLVARSSPPAATRSQAELCSIAQTLVKRQERQAVLAGVKLDLVQSAGDVAVLVDRELFVRAAENIVSNSLEHAPNGSQIEVRVERAGGEASLCVIDGGPSVPPELRSFAVSAEAQQRGSRKVEARYGRGLGLFCADVAARAAGARLEIGGDAKRSLLRLVAPVP